MNTITHTTVRILSATKHIIRVNGKNGGYVFNGHWDDPQNSVTRKHKADIEAYIKANITPAA